MAHAEALLLVDNQQAEIGELDVLRQNAMRADEHIDLSRFDLLQNFLLLLRRPEAADHLEGDWKSRKALLERLEVLKRKNRRRRQHRDLFVIAERLERSAHRNFRLAVTYITAQQTIHRAARLHVGLHIHDRLRLI